MMKKRIVVRVIEILVGAYALIVASFLFLLEGMPLGYTPPLWSVITGRAILVIGMTAFPALIFYRKLGIWLGVGFFGSILVHSLVSKIYRGAAVTIESLDGLLYAVVFLLVPMAILLVGHVLLKKETGAQSGSRESLAPGPHTT